jgi:predicted pyridoxine 5'-phosphate oxidase superfamily flavin-nucleotide-binding protein
VEKSKHKYTSDIAFTTTVKEFQEKFNSRKSYERMEQFGGWQSEVTPELKYFLSTIDSFYLGTSNAEGQPYIQHRGGPKGFLKILDNKRLIIADYAGNKQFISIGNLKENNKGFIFLMDYPNRTRIKIWVTINVIFDDKELLDSLADPLYKARVERAMVFTIDAWDANCTQHIKQRFTSEDIDEITKPLRNKIKELEEKLTN